MSPYNGGHIYFLEEDNQMASTLDAVKAREKGAILHIQRFLFFFLGEPHSVRFFVTMILFTFSLTLLLIN